MSPQDRGSELCGPKPERPSFAATGDNFVRITGPEADTLTREWLEMEALRHFHRFGYWPGRR